MTSRVGRYALYQFRDYALGSGGATLICGVLFVLVASVFTLNGMPVGAGSPFAKSTVAFVFGALGFAGPVIALTNLVSEDRIRGYYRFVLAAPVSPVRFYVQAYLVRGVGLLVIAVLLWLVAFWRIGPVSLPGALAFIALCYLMVGGLTMLFSSLGRFAWLAIGALWVAGGMTTLGANLSTTWSPAWRALHAVLPPFHLISVLDQTLIAQAEPATPIGTYLWFAGYGALAVAALVTVLRKREWGG